MSDILKAYRDSGKPTAAEHQILDRLIARSTARQDAVASLGTSHAFLRIARVVPQEPQLLFGNPVPSRVHNRISVHAEPGGPALISVLLTETALAKMTMGMNRSDDAAELTLETVNGHRLPPLTERVSGPDEVLFNEVEGVTLRELEQSARTAVSKITEAKKVLGKAEAQELARSVRRGFTFQEGQFFAGLYREEESKRAAIIRSEASNLVKSAHLLADPDPDDAAEPRDPEDIAELGPLLPHTDAERAVRARALAYALIQMAKDLGVEGYDPRKGVEKIVSALPYGDARRDQAKSWFADLSRIMSEPRKDRIRDPRHMVGEMARISGSADLHSDSGVDSSGFVALRMVAAEVEHRYGQRCVSASGFMPFFEINITPTDLMMAMRGDPDGDVWTRCSLRQAFGLSVAFTPYRHPLDRVIDTQAFRPGPLQEAQMARGAALADHIQSTGLKSAQDRKEAARMAEDLLDGFPGANAAALASLREACGLVSDHVEAGLREGLEKMMTGRHAQALGAQGGLGLLSGPSD